MSCCHRAMPVFLFTGAFGMDARDVWMVLGASNRIAGTGPRKWRATAHEMNGIGGHSKEMDGEF